MKKKEERTLKRKTLLGQGWAETGSRLQQGSPQTKKRGPGHRELFFIIDVK